jgi:serine phosphatase RsbU (regulator of sigma subunit)
MAGKQPPKYYGFRIYISSSILYFFLVFPFMLYLGVSSIPEQAKSRGWFDHEAAARIDSVATAIDSADTFAPGQIDSLEERAINSAAIISDTISDSQGTSVVAGPVAEHGGHGGLFEEGGPFPGYSKLLFFFSLVCYLIGFIYNLPFKRYFKRLRRRQEIPAGLHAFCKKQLLRTPVYNALIIILPNLVAIVFSLLFILTKKAFHGEMERDIFIRFYYVTLAASLLEFLFAYYWQKHRVHLKYIDHLYTKEELRVKVFRRKGGRIRDRFLISSVITTFLPLMIVVVYLVLSITSVKDLGLENLTQEQREILIGPYYGSLFNIGSGLSEIEKFQWMFYVNAGDSLLMIIGICNGILVSFIYLLLFIRWTSQDITRPVKELLVNIRNTRAGETQQYTVVRTNDEIGELAEGYNEMAKKIHEHVERISRMNRDLEKTVKERTQEVVMQKEEIEAQKEEIEAQLDLATQQRDTITRQKDQILDSIRYAEKIQSAILPPAEYLAEFFSDHFILFKPRDIISGDYYWTSYRNDRLLVAVADCTGHGVPGAFLSVLGISSMNEIMNRKGPLHANRILEHLRDFVIHSLHQTGIRREAQDGIEIALCVIDPRKMTMEFAGANRPLYLVRACPGQPDKPSELMHVRGDRMPIGIYEQESVPFTNHHIPLQKGDTIYLFSDGYVDQLGGPRRKTFRSVHFRKLLMQIQERSLEDQKKILLETHHTWRGDIEQIDDILVLGIRV